MYNVLLRYFPLGSVLFMIKDDRVQASDDADLEIDSMAACEISATSEASINSASFQDILTL